MPKLSEAEKRVISLWINTETGSSLLKNIEEAKQNYIDEAMLGTNNGPQYTHDRIVAAQAVETIYQWLKSFQTKPERPDEDDN